MSDMKRQQIEYVKANGLVGIASENTERSMAHPEFQAECDINNIMKRYQSTGEFQHLTSRQGRYADFSEIKDYQSMCDQVLYAEQAFMSLPAEIRSRFRNNPGELLQFVQDEKNYEEAVKLGLANPRADKTKTETAPNDEQTKQTTNSADIKQKEAPERS